MGSRRRTQRTCSVMQDITNAESFRFTLLCPKISIFNELCMESESNTPVKDPKAIIFRKFIFGGCLNGTSVRVLVFPACAFGHKLRYVFMSKASFFCL